MVMFQRRSVYIRENDHVTEDVTSIEGERSEVVSLMENSHYGGGQFKEGEWLI